MKFKAFPLVHIKFYDHLEGPSPDLKPAVCECFGILKKEDSLAYYVVSWIYETNLEDHNTGGYCILKSAVISFKKVEGGREK